MRHEFEAELWPWEARVDSWFFVTLPPEVSDAVADAATDVRGFGSVPVTVWVGGTQWTTSVFPDQGRGAFVLPVKKAVRTAERLAEGEPAMYAVEVRG